MYYVAILVALAGTAVEAGRIVGPNGGCCLPRKMSMVEGMMLGRVVEQKGSVMLGSILLAMDQDQQKTFSNITLVEGTKVTAMLVYQDYKNGTQYIVKGNKCSKSQLGAWVPKCVPRGATDLGSAYFGHAGRLNGVRVNSYMFTDGQSTAYITVTQEKTCLPVTEVAYGSSNNVPYTLSLDFVNSTNTVSPGIFTVPTICNGASVPVLPQQHPIGGSILFR